MEQSIINYSCVLGKQSWEATLCTMCQNPHSVAFKVMVAGSQLDVCVGVTGEYRWIVFPIIEKGGEVAHFQDEFWNYESIYRILKNKVEALSVAKALAMFENIA